eukprot:4651588-Amphidinium_carterae.1
MHLLELLGSTNTSYRCLRMLFCMHRYDGLQHLYLHVAQEVAVPDIFAGIGGPPPVGLLGGSFSPLGGSVIQHIAGGSPAGGVQADSESVLREQAAQRGDVAYITRSLQTELNDCGSAIQRRRLLRN